MKKNHISIFKNNRITAEANSIIFDFPTQQQFKTITNYEKKNPCHFDKKEILKLKKRIESQLFNQIKQHIFTQYRLFEISEEWPEHQEYQTKIATARCLLDPPPETPLSYEHLDEFEALLNTEYQTHNLLSKTKESLLSSLINFSIKLENNFFNNSQSQKINNLLHFLGSKYYFYVNTYRQYKTYILGTHTQKRIENYSIVTMEKEYLRSPNYAMANVALYLNFTVILRKESFNMIYNQKWAVLFEENPYLTHKLKSEDSWNIAHGIKQITLEKYNIRSQEDLEKIKETFLSDMIENILYHEIGHANVFEEHFPIKTIACATGSKFITESYEALSEIFADLAPFHQNIYGPYYHLIQTHKTNKEKAERLFFIYLSDVWFYDTDDTFMFLYSDLLCMILLRYIQPDLSINFDKMEHDLQFELPLPKNRPLSLYEKLYTLLQRDTDHIIDTLEKATYTSKFEHTFKEFRSYYKEHYFNENPKGDFNSYAPQSSFYTNFLYYLKTYSNKTYQKLDRELKQKEKLLLKKVMILSCGKQKAEAYNFDHRQYIMDQFKALNIKAKIYELI